MKHIYQLGLEVKIKADQFTDQKSRAHGYNGYVGTIIGLTAKPDYETEYVVALRDKFDNSSATKKRYKLHVNEADIRPVRTVKAFAYRIKNSKKGEIVWHMEDIGDVKNLVRVPELDMEKEVA